MSVETPLRFTVVAERAASTTHKLCNSLGVASRGVACCAGHIATTHATNRVAATMLTLVAATLRRADVNEIFLGDQL